MKKLFISIGIFATLLSCNKKDNNQISTKVSIIGNWKSLSNNDSIFFTKNQYKIDDFPRINYITNKDTISDISETMLLFPTWTFYISENNDTLKLYSIKGIYGLYGTFIRN